MGVPSLGDRILLVDMAKIRDIRLEPPMERGT